MNPEELLFQPSHEWTRISDVDGSKIATIGISAFAIEELSDLVYMDLPSLGTKLQAGDEFGEVESVKAVSSLYSPVTGEVVEVNTDLPNNLESLGADPYGAGWIMKVRLSDSGTLSNLLSYADYQKQCAEEA